MKDFRNLEREETQKIVNLKVVGIGGAGNNAINRMIEDKVKNVEFIAINTERKILSLSKADKVIQIGKETTGGLSTGGIIEIGEMAVRENIEQIERALYNTDIVFITAGMGRRNRNRSCSSCGRSCKKTWNSYNRNSYKAFYF